MKKIVAGLFFAVLGFYMLTFPERAYTAAADALSLCARAVVPTLFVFFICSNFFVLTGFGKLIKKPFTPVMEPLFSVNGAGAVALVLGFVCGYPVGAVSVCGLYRSGDITKNEAQRLLGFTSCAGPMFVIGSVGAVMLGDKSAGYVLWSVHLAAAVICGIILRIFSKRDIGLRKNSDSGSLAVSLSEAIAQSVKNSVSGVLSVCGYTVLFSVIISMVYTVFGQNGFSLFIGGLLEMTNGAGQICSLGLSDTVLQMLAFFLGFGGMCVHLQVIGVSRDTGLSLRLYFLGKIMHGAVSYLIMFLLTKFVL